MFYVQTFEFKYSINFLKLCTAALLISNTKRLQGLVAYSKDKDYIYNMEILSVSASILFVVLFVGVSSDDLLPFAEKTKQNLPTETFQKVYGVNFKDDNDVKNAVLKGISKFGKEFDIKVSDKVIEVLTKGALALKDKLTPDIFFRLYANPADQVLRQKGLLNDDNLDQLAAKYADILKGNAEKVDKPDLIETLPAVAGAVGTLLTYLDVDKSVSKPLFEKVVAEFGKVLK